MINQIFVNLPVKDLPRTIDFFSGLGFTFNPKFTDDSATCLIVTDTIFVMLLTEERFQTFTPKPVSDATKTTEMLLALSVDSRQQVNDMVAQAASMGGTTYNEPQDHGFMFGHGFQDLDGQPFTALNGGPQFRFNEAISFQVMCDTQEAIDYYWERLSVNGDEAAQQCGWLKDQFGVSWQIVPSMIGELIGHSDPEKARRATKEMLKMKKLDIEALRQA